MSESLMIGGESIAPGERKTIDLKLASLVTHTDMHMPVHVIRSKRAGPTLLVCAAIHGDEVNGVEVIRRLCNKISLNRLRGTLIAIPIVNVYGFIHHSRYLPDRRDLNRCFPGSPKGSMASQLAHIFVNEIVSKCTHGIDLHTAAIHRENLPQIRACIEDEDTRMIAEAFQAPVIMDSSVQPGTLRGTAVSLGIPWLVYEAGEALRFDEISIRAGVDGVMNVMRSLNMLARGNRKQAVTPRVAKGSAWMRAPKSGIMRLIIPTGALVKQGDVLGFVADPYGDNETAIVADRSGIVIGRANLPMVNQGEAVMHIARFKNVNAVAGEVESFQVDMEPDWDNEELYPEDAPIV
ncbi:succinylglutamate desuccinylase/aspartoacylase family protein [Mariprofundus sp. KV]|uniref:succinylglutamate desuccinylase/aspartoacylase family protein n=1 Tax=Mariprofundus sp. KV TaxID=2608715 RepID=UPI00159F86F1|nr:succinylglutamate desuccinylase/aspartoacylase family protein [Mariprofundus sp. KV]NWF35932.1 succinylglutamate desuccinylase/aspartoacylase family protein [Mariprofundus sp. KV]